MEHSEDSEDSLVCTIIPKVPRCRVCTLRGGCNHHTFNEALQYLKDEINSYPQQPEKEVCYNFMKYGYCKSFQNQKHCNFHHPLDLVEFPKRMKIAQLRCPVCTLPACNIHKQAKKMRKNERKTNRKSKEIASKTLAANSGFMKEDEIIQRKNYESARCMICTLKLPCKHFPNFESMKDLCQKERSMRERYPRDGETSEKCLYFMFTGNCPMYDTHGVCLFWHPPGYANHTIRLPDEIKKGDSELLGYGHGYNGLPGWHRSMGSYGNENLPTKSLRTTRLMLEQDERNLTELRKRLAFGYGRTFKGGIRKFKKWHCMHPPISRTPLKDKSAKKSWKERLKS